MSGSRRRRARSNCRTTRWGGWQAERRLEPRTRELYTLLLRRRVLPYLGERALKLISSQTVRTWRTELLSSGRSELTAAKSYRLLRAMLNTAVREDQLIRENPCRIRGYDKEPTTERPIASVPQVYRLADSMPKRYRTLVLFAAFTGLRWGELIALRRSDLNLDTGCVRVWRKFAELQTGRRVAGPPKSASGRRTVALPMTLVEDVRHHLDEFVDDEPEALLFRGPKGAALRRNNFHRAVGWADRIQAARLPERFHFHDLRHTGNNLAAASGASTPELMHRMGHGSMRAALITSMRPVIGIVRLLMSLVRGSSGCEENDDGI